MLHFLVVLQEAFSISFLLDFHQLCHCHDFGLLLFLVFVDVLRYMCILEVVEP